MPISIT
jgi:hypothetical protein